MMGDGQTSQGSLTAQTTLVTNINDNGSSTDLYLGGVTATAYWNPVGGTDGVDISTAWTDDGDGTRVENIGNSSADLWNTVTVVRGTTYHTDPRYFFIDFDALKTFGLISDIPASAAADNCFTSTCTGSYIWYVDNNGNVQSLSYQFPSSTGFQTGEYP